MSLRAKLESEGSILNGGLKGGNPTGPLKDSNTPGINTTFSKGEYENNLPGGIDVRIAQDSTPPRR